MSIVVGLTPDIEASAGERPSSSYVIRTSYIEVVHRAGGLPVVLPYLCEADDVASYLDRIDALVVTGGAFDVPAELYGEQPGPRMGALKPDRTSFETAMIRGALDREMPLLAVCGGMQLLNVVYAGTLHQDILSDLEGAGSHEQDEDPRQPSHDVTVKAGTVLASCVRGASMIQVNSTHHQAVKTPGPGLIVSGRAPDGVIEAIEDPAGAFVLGVQWHPELLAEPGNEQQSIYDALVRAVLEGLAKE